MDIALVVITWVIAAVAGGVALFVLTLVIRHASAMAQKRRRVSAERNFRPMVEGILSGTPDPEGAIAQLTRGSETWAIVEQMLRRAALNEPSQRAERAQRFLDTAGFAHHYRRLLINGNRFERAEAAGRLADYQCTRAVGDLVAACTDDNRDVRTAAVRALGRLGDEMALPALVSLLEGVASGHEPLSRRIVAGSLSRFGAEAARELLPLATHGSWRVRGAAVYVLGQIGEPSTLSTIIGRLADGDTDVRAKAAEALGNLRVRGALFPLLSCLEDGAWLVRMHAVRALGKLCDPMAVSAISRRLTDSHWRVRQEAAQALSRMEAPALKALTQTLMTTDDRYAREQVVEELQRTPVLKDAIHRLAALPADSALDGPEAALLTEVGRIGAVSMMVGALAHHADPRVRMALVRLLAEVDHARIDPALSHAARTDTDPLIRQEAAYQLKRRAPDTEVA